MTGHKEHKELPYFPFFKMIYNVNNSAVPGGAGWGDKKYAVLKSEMTEMYSEIFPLLITSKSALFSAPSLVPGY